VHINKIHVTITIALIIEILTSVKSDGHVVLFCAHRCYVCTVGLHFRSRRISKWLRNRSQQRKQVGNNFITVSTTNINTLNSI